MLAAEPTPGVRGIPLRVRDGRTASGRGSSSTTTARRCSTRRDVRDVVAITALCEIAEESAAGGDLDELLAQLVALRLTESPEGIDEAEEAVRALQQTIGTPPQLASPARLDEIGAATRRLEQALDPAAPSPFTAALKGAQGDDRRAAEGGRAKLPRAARLVTLVTSTAAARFARLAHGRRRLLSVGR